MSEFLNVIAKFFKGWVGLLGDVKYGGVSILSTIIVTVISGLFCFLFLGDDS